MPAEMLITFLDDSLFLIMLLLLMSDLTIINIICIFLSYLPNHPLLVQDMTQGQFFLKWSLTGLNSEFSFSYTSCLTKAELPSLPYYLPIVGRRIIGFIPFPRVLVLCEMQWVSSRIWTHVAVSISYDNNHFTTGMVCIFLSIFLFFVFNHSDQLNDLSISKHSQYLWNDIFVLWHLSTNAKVILI